MTIVGSDWLQKLTKNTDLWRIPTRVLRMEGTGSCWLSNGQTAHMDNIVPIAKKATVIIHG